MEVLVENPGFRHLAIKIFQNLDFESLQKCLQVNSTWYEVIQDQRFAWILQLHKMEEKSMADKWFQSMKPAFLYYKKQNFAELKQFVGFMKRFYLENRFSIKYSPLTFALAKSDLNGLEYLMKSQIEMNGLPKSDDDAETMALHFACAMNQPKSIQFYLEHSEELKTNVNAINFHGLTPFQLACNKGQVDVVKTFLKFPKNVDFNETDRFLNHTAFLNVCFSGSSTKIVELLIDNAETSNIDLDVATSSGRSGLHLASVNEQLEIVEILLKRGINVNAVMTNGQTAFHRACIRGRFKVVELFLKYAEDSNLNRKDNNGWTGFDWACKKDHANIVKILLQNASKLGIEVNTRDTNGVTRLHHACNSGHVAIVRAFIEHKKEANIDLNVKDNYGWTPLDFALHKRHLPIIAMFKK